MVSFVMIYSPACKNDAEDTFLNITSAFLYRKITLFSKKCVFLLNIARYG